MIKFEPLISLLQVLIHESAENPNPPPPAESYTAGSIPPEYISSRFRSTATAAVAIANSIYRRAGGVEGASDHWAIQGSNPININPAVVDQITPLGAILVGVIEGILCARVIAESYEFDWVNDEDSFLQERLQQIVRFIADEIRNKLADPEGGQDPALQEILDYLTQDLGIENLAESYSANPTNSNGENEIMVERWSRLAGILIKE